MSNSPEQTVIIAVPSSTTLQGGDDAVSLSGNGTTTRSLWIRRCHLCFLLMIGAFLFGVGTAQAIVASELHSKGIQVLDIWLAENPHMVAGDRVIGILACAVGMIVFLVACSIVCLSKISSSRCMFNALSIILSLLATSGIIVTAVIRSFSESETYFIVDDIAYCTAIGDGIAWRGSVSCTCVDVGGGKWYVDAGSDTTCEAIPEYADDILTSLVMTYILIGFMCMSMVSVCWRCCLKDSYDEDRVPVVRAVPFSSPDQVVCPVELGGQLCATNLRRLTYEPVTRPVQPSLPGK